MSTKKMLVLLGTLILSAIMLAACGGAGEPGPAGPAGPAGAAGPAGPAGEAAPADLTCDECHNDTAVIAGKAVSYEESLHGSGEATAYAGARADCAGCHSGGGFSAALEAGVNPAAAQETADANPSRPDCRACHAIHTSYTAADWALETTDPVVFLAFEDVTYDGGEGNLCANCHQARRDMAPDVTDGVLNWSSSHYGPHHGPQSNMLMGNGGGTGVEGSPSAHYSMVENTCVACHMGEGMSHSFEPNVAACQGCHADLEDFDLNGAQTEVAAMLAELQEALIAKGMLTEEDESVVGEYPEAEGAALWNYIYIAHEDKSMGVHNSAYTKALLEASLEALK